MSRALAVFLVSCSLHRAGAVDADSVELLQVEKTANAFTYDYFEPRAHDYDDEHVGQFLHAVDYYYPRFEYPEPTNEVGLAKRFQRERRAHDYDYDARDYGNHDLYDGSLEGNRRHLEELAQEAEAQQQRADQLKRELEILTLRDQESQQHSLRRDDSLDDAEDPRTGSKKMMERTPQEDEKPNEASTYTTKNNKNSKATTKDNKVSKHTTKDAKVSKQVSTHATKGKAKQKGDKPKQASLSKTRKAVYSKSLDSAAGKFAELSDMLPNNRGACPKIDGQDDKPMDIGDITICEGRMAKAEKDGACLVYYFSDLGKMTKNSMQGIGRDFVSNFAVRFPGCKIFLFDATRTDLDVKTKLFPDPRISFKPWSLGNMSLPAIERALGHTGKHISLLRSDCNGCEWDWVHQALKEDPAVFSRIDSMAMELQMVKVEDSQNWTDGLPAQSRIDSMNTALTKNFRVLSGYVEPGRTGKQDQVPVSLQEQGVLGHPCCRQINLVSYSGSDRKTATLLKAEASTGTISQVFANRFKGLRGDCPGDVGASDDVKFCPQTLREAEEREECLAYIFGASTPREIKFLQAFRHNHSTCQLHVFDPKTTLAKLTSKLASKTAPSADSDPYFFFKPIGIYTGEGPRVIKSTSGVRGELYTLGEIYSMWDFSAVSENKTQPSTPRISLLKGDFASAPREVWEKQTEQPGFVWWGTPSIDQMA